MKNRKFLLLENWIRVGLFAAFAAYFSLTLQAQNGPVKQWVKTLGGTNNDQLYALQQTSDGGYILGGYSQSGLNGDKSENVRGSWDYWVVKTDANGNKTWDKTFGGSNPDYLLTLQQTLDGGFLLGG